VFPEWLFGTCHHIIVQDYVRILSSWCSVKAHASKDICTKLFFYVFNFHLLSLGRFMLAVSLLDCGEAHKAVHLFQQTAPGVVEDDFLFEHVLKNTPLYSKLQESVTRGDKISAEDKKLAIVHYYLKIIQLFEQHSALDYVIELAHMAMSVLQRDDPQLPMFQSIVFNNHLQLGHYEEAYYALVYNADTSRRKDCLRQLVITLFQNKCLPLLMQFPYIGLQDEFESIVESRARSMSIDQNDVYNFLYAFHTNKGNMRKGLNRTSFIILFSCNNISFINSCHCYVRAGDALSSRQRRPKRTGKALLLTPDLPKLFALGRQPLQVDCQAHNWR